MNHPQTKSSKLNAVLVLATLVALGVTASPGHAQDGVLNAGQVTVSGSGTALGGGYSGSGFDPSLGGVTPYNSVRVNGGVFALQNGGTVNGAATDGFGNSYALETTGAGLADVFGGTLNYDTYTYDASTVGVSGGTLNGNLYDEDSSSANVSGGTLNGTLYAYSGSTVNVSGGALDGTGSVDAVYSYDGSTVTISGGVLSGLQAYGNSTVNVSGGTILTDGLNALDSSTINVTGGTVSGLDALSGTINFAGGANTGTLIVQGGVIDLFGQFAGYNPGDIITSGLGSFTGALLHGGGAQTFQFDATQGGVIEFDYGTPPSAPAPEPSAWAALGLGGLAIIGSGLKARRRTSQRKTAPVSERSAAAGLSSHGIWGDECNTELFQRDAGKHGHIREL